jgi:hypothetical protein
MAVGSSQDDTVEFRARRPRTMKLCSVDARSQARPSHSAVEKVESPCDGAERRWKRICASVHQIVAAATVLSLAACAGPEPLLRSNAHFQLQGREAAQDDVDACQNKAETAGLNPGTSRSANAASGGTIGLVGGAAVGAASGIIGGATGVAIGAAVGGGLGLIIGLAGGAYKPLEPDPPYADAVVRCLIEKGYEVSGWQ